MGRAIEGFSLSAFAARAGMAAFAWWILVEGRGDAWPVGVALAAAAALASLWLCPPGSARLRPLATGAALAWFLRRSLAAGLDVALRALRPRMPLAPGFVSVVTRLEHPTARVLLADGLSLLPGTLCAELEGSSIVLHVLDRDAAVERDVRELESRIAAMFGESPGAGR